MARVTAPPPSTAALEDAVDVSEIEDYEPYRVRIAHWEWSIGLPEYGSKKQVLVDWEFVGTDGPTGRTRDWVYIGLGRNGETGKPSKFTTMLNALAKMPEESQIAWFDDETGEWSYDGAPYCKLSEGLELIVRGKVKPTKNGDGNRFKVEIYQPIKKKKRAQPQPEEDEDEIETRKRAKVQDVSPDEIPF